MLVGDRRGVLFDSFRVNMEKGGDQVYLIRATLSGKLHSHKEHKQNTPMALSLFFSRVVVWKFAELSGGEVSSMMCEMHGNCCDSAAMF